MNGGVYLTMFNKWRGILKDLEELINSKKKKEQDLPDVFRGVR